MPTGKLLTKMEVLQVQDKKYMDVEVPEWDGSVRVGVMSGTDREKFESFVESRMSSDGKTTNMSDVRATLLSLVLVDGKGERMFSQDDVKALGDKNGAVLARLADIAMRVNGLTKESVEELRKNS